MPIEATIPRPTYKAPDPVKVKAKVAAYLDGLKTFHAQFQQYTPNQPVAEGRFSLKRPGKFLWEYDTPDALKLVSDGGLIYFQDLATNQVTQVPRDGLADLLTRRHIKFDQDGLNVTSIKAENGIIYLTLHLPAPGPDGSAQDVTLGFIEDPIQLRQVRTIDQFGQMVRVVFYDVRENDPMADKTFAFTPPQYKEK